MSTKLLTLFTVVWTMKEAVALTPMFEKCNSVSVCESGTVCRFEVCLPPMEPVPVYVYAHVDGKDEQPRQFSTPSVQSVRPQKPVQSLTQESAPIERIHNVVVEAPLYAANQEAPQKPCPTGCSAAASCLLGRCICTGIEGQLRSMAECSSFSQFRSQPTIRPSPIQAPPGAPCDANTECTGGSVCVRSKCECPPELLANGQVCVSPAIFGLPHRGLPGY